MVKINVYDFDGTLYRGESMLDFYFFCLKRRPILIKFMFVMLFNLIKYKMCIINERQFETLARKYAKQAVTICPDANELAKQFWSTHKNRLNKWYEKVKDQDDAVVSASFSFLLQPAMKMLGIVNLVSSEIDVKTGNITKLCFAKDKIKCFKKEFPGSIVNYFYTDSMNDKAFMSLAKGNVYMVKKGRIFLYNGKSDRKE